MSKFAKYPSLDGATVFLTGGASGIGADMVRAFTDQDAKVGFLDFDQEGSEAIASETGALFQHCDLRDIIALRTSMQALLDQNGLSKGQRLP